MADRTCEKCGKAFDLPCRLKAHKTRKTLCDPILIPPEDRRGEFTCRYCGRTFTMATSMHRHIRQSCKIANSEEGMEKLLDHTLQRQLADQNAKIDKLTALIEKMTVGQLVQTPPCQQILQPINAPSTVNNAPVTNTTIVINAWDGDRRIGVELAHIMAAFAENAKLREYARLGDHELTDPEIAPPYVTELLMDLTKRAHATPEARNIYLNPRRADQALVHKNSGQWEVLPLAEATRLLFDGVAATIHRTTMSADERRQLPLEAQNALSIAGMLYDDEPEEYARRAKAPMMAHLENCRTTTIVES